MAEYSTELVTVPVQAVPETEPLDPYGKKKGYMSWQEVIRRISGKTIDEITKEYGAMINNLQNFAPNTTLRELVIIKAFESMLNTPNPSMLSLIMEREEGKVPQSHISATGNIGDWMEYAKENEISIDEVMEEAKKIMANYENPEVIEGEIVE